MTWLVWCIAAMFSGAAYQLSLKVFSGRLPIFLYTAIVSVTLLTISIIGLGITYKAIDFTILKQKNILPAAICVGVMVFMVDMSLYMM